MANTKSSKSMEVPEAKAAMGPFLQNRGCI